MKSKTSVLFIISSLSFVVWLVIFSVKAIKFDQKCGGYLERAANANTIELAERELAIAIDYLDKNEIKSGFTSVVYQTPDEDVGYWYENLSASLKELRSINENSAPLERSNVLLKLRETLMDNGKYGDKLTIPGMICVYPNNALFFWWLMATVIGLGSSSLKLCFAD